MKKKKLNLFISQPMSDKTDEEIKTERKKAIKSVQDKYGDEYDIKVLDSYIEYFTADDKNINKPLYYLGRALQILAEADIAYFCKGWEKYRDCKIENEAAIAYDIPLVIEDYTNK